MSATDGGIIKLYGDGDDVVGKDASGDIVFRLHMDESSGDVTLWQYEAINHGWDGNDHDALKELADGVLKVKVTVYDKDGDYDKAYVDLGKVIGFEDDGPKITCFELGYRAHVIADESKGILGSLQDEPGQVLPADEWFHSPGPDGAVIGYARVDGDDLFKLTVDAGSDKEDTSKRTFEFSVSNGAFSGLYATDGGAITLFNNGDDVVGKDANGDIVFRLRIDEDDGDVTLWQYEAINHGPDGNDHDALKELADGVLKVKVTVYDKDGDYDKAYVDLGKVIGFEDDGPAAGLSFAFVDEDGNAAYGASTLPDRLVGGPDDSNFNVADTGRLAIDAGSDGLKSVAFAEGTAHTLFGQVVESGGHEVMLDWQAAPGDAGGVLEGYYMNGDVRVSVFTLELAANNLDYTFALHQPLDHNVPGTEDELYLKLDFTVTDGDGDTADGVVKVVVDDDTPVLNDNSIESCLTVTYEGGDAGFSNSYGYYIKAPDGTPTVGAIIWANVHDIAVGTSATVSGLNPEDVGFFIIPNGASFNGGVAGYADGAALTFVEGVDGWQAYLGGVPLTGDGGANALFDNPLLNPTDDSHVQDNAAPGNENWEDVHVGGDSDFNDVNVQVQWKNLVHEDKLSVLDAPIPAPYEGNEELSQSLVATGGDGTLLSLVNFGADGPGTVSLIDGDVNAVMSGANPGLTSGGEPLFYSVSGGVLTAYAGEGGDPVFSLSVTEGGGYTFTLLGPLDHDATPATDNDLDTLVANAGIDFTRVLNITDYDGDPVDLSNASGRFVIRVEDDAPIATCDAACFTEQAATTNILMAFDFSNSMFFDAEGGGNRFEAIYGAVDDMFAAYDAQGDVNIRIVGFSNGAAEGNGLWTSGWFSSATAAAQWLLDTFNDPGRSQPGGTNYEAALDAARAAWADGTPTEGSNVAYFITDGYSNGGDTYGATGDWSNFLTDEGFIGNYVVAVGGSGDVDDDGTLFDLAELNAIATGAGGEVILADFGSIAEDLAGTAVLNQLEGNLVTGDAHGGVADLSGADGWLKDDDGNDAPLVSVKFDRNGDGDFDDADESYDIAQDGPTLIDLGGDLGSIEFYANGQYVYKAGDLPAGEQTLNFQYTVMDNDRTSSTACFELNLKGIQNTLPQVGEAIARVSEEGLSTPAAPYEGLEDNVGHLSGDDTTNATSVINGVISISDADGDALTVTLAAPAPGVFMSGGVPVVWSGDGTNHLVGTKGVGGVTILEVSVTADGHYSVELKGPVDHPYQGEGTAGEDVLSHDFIVQVSDGTGMSEGKITVQIEDDSPVANAVTKTGQAAVGTDTNLLIVLDVSGSMGDPANVGGMSRLEVAKSALLELFEQYDALGDVKVSLVTFATGATTNQVWVNLSDAKAAVLALNDGGNTNYDAALINAINAYGQTGSSGGKLTGTDVQNVAYFLSDGYPNEPGSDAGISNSDGTATDWPTAYNDTSGNNNQASEEQTWINFLNANDIRAYSLGMGTGVDAGALNPIAYDGSTGTNTNAIVVSNLNNLTATLVATAQASPINGNLKENGGGFGADGGFVRSLTVGGNTYTYNGAGAMVGATPGATFNSMTNVLTIVLAASAGTLAVNMDSAAFTFTPPDSIGSGGIDQSIGFVLQDFDGDYSGNTLSLHIDPAQSVTVVRDDLVLTNQTTINLPDWTLLHNDTGPNSATQSITGVGSSSGLTSLSHGGGSTLIVDNATAGGSFAYTNSVSPTDEGHVDVVRSTGDVINGTFRDEILIGGAGADTLNGGDGNDILIGGGTPIAVSVAASVTADGASSSSNADFLHFAFMSGGAGDYIQSIAINLQGGLDGNATFDNDWGPSFSGLSGLSSGDISYSGNTSPTLTLNFAAGKFGLGDSFNLNIDVDNLNPSDRGIDFAGRQVEATITLQDGRTQTVTFVATDGTDGNSAADDAAVANFNLSPLSDLLNGGNGDDLLIGSTGVDIMTGGAGKDIFAWQPGGLGGGADHITDFHVDTSGVTSDALDLSQLLTGLSATPSGAELSNYLTFTFGGGSTTINVDANGSAGGVQTDQTIILDGVNLSSGSYYGSTDAGTIISGLLDDHALKVA
ncbi:DUF5801 repeats-in-toxin domain-containing protein [Pseudomonas sp. BMS12]|uniref:DUF5801 repeats-in-toxin domain-containing protein n=1 Tax=Pseudomonas sp. BMS12 TaxID=1796033 RepID=UPI00083AF608|nr:DUF5801 repeats-in-toxin domain-containing protein [Pseudomonas sp. BMS12]